MFLLQKVPFQHSVVEWDKTHERKPMDPTFNHLGCFCVEWVVGKLHVYPGTLMGIRHGFICKKKLHKPPVGRVPMETLPAWLGTDHNFLLPTAGTKQHRGPNIFLVCHLGKVDFRMYLFKFYPLIIFPDLHQRGKGYHISSTLGCQTH